APTMDTSLPAVRANSTRGGIGGVPCATPSQLNPLQALAHLVNPLGATHDSPVLLPLLQQVEASPTTGIHQLCPPLFQSQSQPARLPLPIPVRTEAAAVPETNRGIKREYEARIGNGKQSVANSDGWQWRKYGEKLVKGSQHPWSYYKCSHPGCTAKKKVWRSKDDGAVLTTEYKGEHCHAAPLTCKPSRFKPKPKAEPVAAAFQRGQVPEASALSQFPSGMLGMPALGMQTICGGGMLPIPDTLQSDFPAVTHAAASMAVEPEDDTDASDPEPAMVLRAAPQDARAAHAAAAAFRSMREAQDSPSKRLDMLAAYAEEAQREYLSHSNSPDLGPSSKRQRTEGSASRNRLIGDEDEDPSVVSGVQHLVDGSDLDDGFRWRKYGEKKVKGNEFPRAYYKCTQPGCPVRKHVERHPTEEAKFIVTYEGQHTHAAPDAYRRRGMKDGEGYELGDAREDSSQPMSPRFGAPGTQPAPPLPLPGPQPGAAADATQQAQQQGNELQPAMLQHAVVTNAMPMLPYNALTSEALASLGLSVDALQGMETLGALNGNLADLATLLRQHTQADMAIAAQAQAMEAGWDPLACLITPRPNVSPAGLPFGHTGPSGGTGKQGKPAAQARQQVATTDA
ncbi:hypothetical protein Agub_g2639, partial [Astrephomene gubernaculifera]